MLVGIANIAKAVIRYALPPFPIVARTYQIPQGGSRSKLAECNNFAVIRISQTAHRFNANPATYTGLFGDIRDLFSQTKDAKAKEAPAKAAPAEQKQNANAPKASKQIPTEYYSAAEQKKIDKQEAKAEKKAEK